MIHCRLIVQHPCAVRAGYNEACVEAGGYEPWLEDGYCDSCECARLDTSAGRVLRWLARELTHTFRRKRPSFASTTRGRDWATILHGAILVQGLRPIEPNRRSSVPCFLGYSCSSPPTRVLPSVMNCLASVPPQIVETRLMLVGPSRVVCAHSAANNIEECRYDDGE